MNGLFLNAICEYLSDHGTACVQIGEATPVSRKAGFQDLTYYPPDVARELLEAVVIQTGTTLPEALVEIGAKLARRIQEHHLFGPIVNSLGGTPGDVFRNLNRAINAFFWSTPDLPMAAFRVIAENRHSLILGYIPGEQLATGTPHFMLGFVRELVRAHRPDAEVAVIDYAHADTGEVVLKVEWSEHV